MKYLKKFNESDEEFDEFQTWEDIQSGLDVYQLYELLVFKYGNIFIDTKAAIDEEEGDYNPDQIYEVIEMELKNKNLWLDFLKNHESYQNDKEEADPYHWKHRRKSYDDLMKSWDEDPKL